MGSLIFDLFMLITIRLFIRKQPVQPVQTKQKGDRVNHVFIPFEQHHHHEVDHNTQEYSGQEHVDQFSDSFPDDWDY